MLVDCVLHRVLANEVTVLVDVVDEDDDGIVLLGVVRQHLCTSDGCRARGPAAGILAIVQRRERVLENEQLFLRVLLDHVVSVVQQVLDHDVLPCNETVLEFQTLGCHRNLEQRLLTRVEQANMPLRGDAVAHLQKRCGLACARATRQHHDRTGNEPFRFTTQCVIEPIETYLLALAQLGRDVDVVDVGVLFVAFDANFEIHFRHFLVSFEF